jgi:GDPmannose 4,6-dehydratase
MADMAKRALITGVLGQDGAYLAKLLVGKGYEVFGGARRSSSMNTWRLAELGIENDVRLLPLDLLEMTNLMRVIEQVRPDELYNLAAQSFVAASFDQPLLTSEIDAIGAARLLEALRAIQPKCRFYQASTSEMFGKVRESPQTEMTPFHPRSPYAVAKAYAHYMTVNYREAFGLHASSGILFNHESPLRGHEFVTRKVTLGLAAVKQGRQEAVDLGNVDSARDWGFAGDYVEGMWRMVQQPQGDDYVLATGESHSVREFVEMAATAAGFSVAWEGKDETARAVDRKSGKTIVRVNPAFYRPAEVDVLRGDSKKARATLGWKPAISFAKLVEIMMEADLRREGKHLLG